MLPPIAHRIATEIAVNPRQVEAAVALLDEGATVPFIARYRKEVTGGLDDTQLRTLEERLGYLRELEERRTAIVASIEEQGKLTPELRAQVESAETKQRLEDLYLPYKPKRRTKAQIAREAGLEPLALGLLEDPTLIPDAEAAKFLREPFTTADGDNPGVPDGKAALEGARQILMERFAEQADLLARLRQHMQDNGVLVSAMAEGKAEEGAKFRDYFEYSEPLRDIPSHRALALFRGRNEDILRLQLKLPEEIAEEVKPGTFGRCEGMIAVHVGVREQGRPADPWLCESVRWTWRVKVAWQIESDLLSELRARAEEEAIRVFASNLHDLLLAAPAGQKATMGLDPGLRTGVKVAVVDGTGKVVETSTIYPHAPRNDWDGSIAALAKICARHGVALVSIGNGTASRETDKLTAELMQKHPELKLTKVVVSEAGASVYSASELAAREFPDLDVSLRGAVSIARRLQDPLAELVKIDPKSIGVGQYQHDVSQTKLAKSLDAVVEDCVNAVGVDVNTASIPLLARISGLTASLAENIVRHRDQNGPFPSRDALKQVPRLGPKTYEQAAGFLRIVGGDNPLDASAVHPEAYPVVEKILGDVQRSVCDIMGRSDVVRALDPRKYTDERFGLPTVQDILRELEKPGRDPRPEFKTATFKEGVDDLRDLQPGMVLEGVITNVTNFGAFVDIGVHQDGLVHVSMMARKFVKDPREVVKAGDVVKVKVLEVDEKRKRVALTMRLDETPAPARESSGPRDGGRSKSGGGGGGSGGGRPARPAAQAPAPAGGAMADALARALKGR